MINEPPVGAVVRVTYETTYPQKEPTIWKRSSPEVWHAHGYTGADWTRVTEGAMKIERAIFVQLWPKDEGRIFPKGSR